MSKFTQKTALSILATAALLALSASALAKDLTDGTLVARTLNAPVEIYSIDGFHIVRQDTQRTGPRRFRMEINATVEGNICDATEVASLLTTDNGSVSWNGNTQESSQILTLVPIIPAYSKVDTCEDYSKSSKIKIAVELISSVGPKETHSFQKAVFHVALPIGSSSSQGKTQIKTFTVTDDYELGWHAAQD